MTPTITSITPNVGPSGGRFVAAIKGSGFRTSSDIDPAVRVEIGGIRSRDVRVYSDTEIQILVPSFRGVQANAAEDPIPKQNLRIVNLDDDGDEIVGEEVTALRAFTYERSPIRDPRATNIHQIYRQVIYEVIQMFQRQLLHNTALSTHADYGKDGDVRVLVAVMPAIGLNGPRLIEDMDNRHRWNGPIEVPFDDVQFDSRFSAAVMTFEFDVILATKHQRELFGLTQGLIEMFMRTPVLTLPDVPGDWNAAQLHEFPLVLTTPPALSTQDANADVFIGEATFQVRHIPFRMGEPIDRNQIIDNVALEIDHLSLQIAPLLPSGSPMVQDNVAMVQDGVVMVF